MIDLARALPCSATTWKIPSGRRVRPEVPRRHPRLRVPARERHLLQMSVIARDDHHRLRRIDSTQDGLYKRFDDREHATGEIRFPRVTDEIRQLIFVESEIVLPRQ